MSFLRHNHDKLPSSRAAGKWLKTWCTTSSHLFSRWTGWRFQSFTSYGTSKIQKNEKTRHLQTINISLEELVDWMHHSITQLRYRYLLNGTQLQTHTCKGKTHAQQKQQLQTQTVTSCWQITKTKTNQWDCTIYNIYYTKTKYSNTYQQLQLQSYQFTTRHTSANFKDILLTNLTYALSVVTPSGA